MPKKAANEGGDSAIEADNEDDGGAAVYKIGTNSAVATDTFDTREDVDFQEDK